MLKLAVKEKAVFSLCSEAYSSKNRLNCIIKDRTLETSIVGRLLLKCIDIICFEFFFVFGGMRLFLLIIYEISLIVEVWFIGLRYLVFLFVLPLHDFRLLGAVSVKKFSTTEKGCQMNLKFVRLTVNLIIGIGKGTYCFLTKAVHFAVRLVICCKC